MFDKKIGKRRQDHIPLVEPLNRFHVFAALDKAEVQLISSRDKSDLSEIAENCL